MICVITHEANYFVVIVPLDLYLHHPSPMLILGSMDSELTLMPCCGHVPGVTVAAVSVTNQGQALCWRGQRLRLLVASTMAGESLRGGPVGLPLLRSSLLLGSVLMVGFCWPLCWLKSDTGENTRQYSIHHSTSILYMSFGDSSQ